MLRYTLPDHKTEVVERLQQCDRIVEAHERDIDVVHLHNLVANLEATLGRQSALLDVLHKDSRTIGRTIDHRATQRGVRRVGTNVDLLLGVLCTVDFVLLLLLILVLNVLHLLLLLLLLLIDRSHRKWWRRRLPSSAIAQHQRVVGFVRGRQMPSVALR